MNIKSQIDFRNFCRKYNDIIRFNVITLSEKDIKKYQKEILIDQKQNNKKYDKKITFNDIFHKMIKDSKYEVISISTFYMQIIDQWRSILINQFNMNPKSQEFEDIMNDKEYNINKTYTDELENKTNNTYKHDDL